MVDVNIRPALVQDAAVLARMDNIASHGFTEWFWQQTADATQSGTPSELAEQAMARGDNKSGWTNSVIAELDGQIAGGANGYVLQDDHEIRQPSNEPFFEPVRQLFETAIGDWLLDWISVYETFRGQGVGAALLDHCISAAQNCEVAQASLVAEDSNSSALQLYWSRGFRQRDQRAFIPFNQNSKTQNWLLLSAPVT